jgi:hypothetical protein
MHLMWFWVQQVGKPAIMQAAALQAQQQSSMAVVMGVCSHVGPHLHLDNRSLCLTGLHNCTVQQLLTLRLIVLCCAVHVNSPEGSTSEAACYTTNACPGGTEFHQQITTPSALSDCVCKSGYGSPTGTGICRLCGAGTYSAGGTMEDCKPCPFGTTSAEGSAAKEQCQVPVQQACPIGQWAPEGAVSAEECRCYTGFGGT